MTDTTADRKATTKAEWIERYRTPNQDDDVSPLRDAHHALTQGLIALTKADEHDEYRDDLLEIAEAISSLGLTLELLAVGELELVNTLHRDVADRLASQEGDEVLDGLVAERAS